MFILYLYGVGKAMQGLGRIPVRPRFLFAFTYPPRARKPWRSILAVLSVRKPGIFIFNIDYDALVEVAATEAYLGHSVYKNL